MDIASSRSGSPRPGGLPDPTPLYRLRDGVYAPDLLVAVVAELDLFSVAVAEGPVTVAGLCARLALSPRPADVMITYLAALGLLRRLPGDRVEVTGLARAHLTAGNPHDLRPYFASLRERPAAAELVRVLRTGEPAAWSSATPGTDADWVGRLHDPAFARQITAAMDARGAFLGPALADAVADLPVADLPAAAVLDVGGGSGSYACALADRLPGTRAAVLERPPVDAAARALLADRGYAQRVSVLSGDMFGAVPGGYDLHLYSHVLHDWGEDQVRHLLRASFRALPPGGWLVDHDVHVNEEKTGPLPAAEYSVLLMHSTPGKCWSTGELGEMLRGCGFEVIAVRQTAGDRSALIARKPLP